MPLDAPLSLGALDAILSLDALDAWGSRQRRIVHRRGYPKRRRRCHPNERQGPGPCQDRLLIPTGKGRLQPLVYRHLVLPLNYPEYSGDGRLRFPTGGAVFIARTVAELRKYYAKC